MVMQAVKENLNKDHFVTFVLRRRNRGALGARAPQDFAIIKEVPFSFSESTPFFSRKKVSLKCRAPQV